MAQLHSDPTALIAKREKRKFRSKLTQRVKSAIDALVWGVDDHQNVGIEIAAQIGGITVKSLRLALTREATVRYYREQMKALREGHRAGNLRTAVEIRDDSKLKQTAAGQRVRLAAAALLDADLHQGSGGINVNVGVNVVTPGYVIDLTEPQQLASQPAKAARQIAHLEAHDANAMILLEDVQE